VYDEVLYGLLSNEVCLAPAPVVVVVPLALI
jgi:hypothetical protein